MKKFIQQFFTWWNGATLSVRLFTALQGKLIGHDAIGNCYYQNKKGRRWVVYANEADASTIPPGWHGWIHYRSNDVPSDEKIHKWQKPHVANLTGTKHAYKPSSANARRKKNNLSGDYEAWKVD